MIVFTKLNVKHRRAQKFEITKFEYVNSCSFDLMIKSEIIHQFDEKILFKKLNSLHRLVSSL